MTPHATAAIIRQITAQADRVMTVEPVPVQGAHWTFKAQFTVDWSWEADERGDEYDTASCDLIGAWAYDPQTDDVTFAGNRDELVRLLGHAEVLRWEIMAAEDAVEAGRNDGGDDAYDLWRAMQ